MARRKLVAGNWKMNGLAASAAVVDDLAAACPVPGCDVLICPPATLLARFAGGPFPVGGQDCHPEPAGAHTGDLAAEMLADAGASAVIVGHSERRADHGETEAERDAGLTLDRVGAQLEDSVPEDATAERLVVAYEPVWAIGTGRTPSISEIAQVHEFIRNRLSSRFGAETAGAIRLLYGGSVNPGNAEQIFSIGNVDGALVGGASLKAADFAAIIAAAD
ncbi:MAG TPA: triose-phosphate isomerase [Amaricoccus sp.]|nr:triose-phosphate isomerase [Amaricoccus sp.]